MKHCILIALYLILIVEGRRSAQAAPAPAEPQKPQAHQEHPTRLIAKYSRHAQPQAAARVLEQHRIKVHKHLSLVQGLVVLESEPDPAAGPKARPDPQKLRQRMKALRASGHFEYVEPDYVVKTSLGPTDAAYTDGRLWGLPSVDAERAWDITTGSTSILVAVIDTGIRYTHQDLAAQMWRNPGEIAGNGLDDDHDGYVDNVHGINTITGSGDPFDDHFHGSHVAGTIGAAANNGGAHVGVAWQVRLMACKFLNAEGSGYASDAIECIGFAVSKGARVLNNSWGGGGFSQALHDAIASALDAGVLFVAAAGNNGADADEEPHYPSSYALDNIVSVAAIDRNDRLAGFSNYGAASVHLGAPGVDIYSCGAASDADYRSLNGTSMATPHVSGVAALILARYPSMTVAELKQRLINTTVPTPALAGRCRSGGRVNAYNALTAAPDGTLELAVTTSLAPPLPSGGSVSLYVSVSDLAPVNDATVTGQIVGGNLLAFVNNGTGPDQTAGDNVSSAVLPVPATGSQFTVALTVSAPGKQTRSVNVTLGIRMPPPNDRFASRITLPADSYSVTGSNVDASKEPGEPNHGGNAGGKSVWWTWTAPASGQVSITTVGSSFDTLLGVYTGTALNSLSLVAGNDDSIGLLSAVVISAVSGTTYQIAVDGYGATAGDIQLNITPGNVFDPVNDRFADALPISQSTASVLGSNDGATQEAGEPNHAGISGGKSVWWTWTAHSSGPATMDTIGSTFDTLLAVYTGNAVNALTQIAANDDSVGRASAVAFTAVAGTTYRIAVDGFHADAGGIQLNVSGPAPPPPANDPFASRTSLPGAPGPVTGSNESATKESGEPSHGGNAGGHSVWWTWTAPANGVMRVTTDGSSFDTLLGVYTGSAVNNLTLLAEDDDSGEGLNSLVTFLARAGTVYQIAVDGYGAAAGDYRLHLQLLPPLRLLAPQILANGTRRIWIASSNGQPLDTSRAAHIQILVSPDVARPLSQWTPLTSPVSMTDGMFHLDDTAAAGQATRFYRATELP